MGDLYCRVVSGFERYQSKAVDEGWDVDDLGYFVLLCKSLAFHDCFFPKYMTFIVGEERTSYPTLRQRNILMFVLSYLIWS